MDISLNSRQNKIENAKHNKRACEHIGKVTSFPDWMITTAFYSAIHYVDSRIFPIEITTKDGKRIQCSSLDIYYTLQKNISPDVPPKHEIRKKLAREKLDSDFQLFQRLSDASSTARYVTIKDTLLGKRRIV